MPEPLRGSDRLAVLIADGGHVDWDEEIRSASDEKERRVIRDLRLVESIARIHRSVEAFETESEGTRSIVQGVDQTVRDSAPIPPITTWGHLTLREKLGQGAFGEVYRAWDPRLERDVALKLLALGVSGERALAATAVKEGRLLAKLHHTNVVTVYGAEILEGRVGFWMELIRGRSLEQLLRDQGPFGPREAALIGIDLCSALAAVHGAGVVHSDVKTQNVMREEGGRIVLTDFGAGIDRRADAVDRERTISGTPFYMAPEILRGEPASGRSDLYSLGALLYRLLTASFPIEATSWEELRNRHARQEATSLRDRRPDLPEGIIGVVERALAARPEDRFATPGEMQHALSLALGAASAPVAAAAAPATKSGRGFDLKLRWGRVTLWIGAAVAVAGVALLIPLRLSHRTNAVLTEPPRGHVGEAIRVPSKAALPASPTYTVEASFYRARAHSSARELLEPGARLALGDSLTLEFSASTPLHVYVIDEDEAGHAYALFPLPGLDLENPLPGGKAHVLPGSRQGKSLSWTVDSAGGREHLMILASPTRLVQFEAEMNALERPGQTAVAIPDAAKVRLRGIGGLEESRAPGGAQPAGRLFVMAESLVSRSEVVSGVWMRRIDLENPRPK